MMDIKIGKTYWMSILSGNDKLVYTGKIISIDNNFVTFIDKFKKRLTFNLKNVISFEEVEDGK